MLSFQVGDESVEAFPQTGYFIARSDGTQIPVAAWSELVESDPELDWDTDCVLLMSDGSEMPRVRWKWRGPKIEFQYLAGRIRVFSAVRQETDERPVLLKVSSLATTLNALVLNQDTWIYDGVDAVLPIPTELWPGAPRTARGKAFDLAFELYVELGAAPAGILKQLRKLNDREIQAFAVALLTLAGDTDPEFAKEEFAAVIAGLDYVYSRSPESFKALAKSDSVEQFCEATLARHVMALRRRK